MQFDIGLGTHTGVTATAAPPLNQVLGTVSMGSIGIFISPYSYVDIYMAPEEQVLVLGVSFGIHMQIDQFNMDYISWGDKDGFKIHKRCWFSATVAVLYSRAWFPVGISYHCRLYRASQPEVGGPITITGTVNIDVGTVTMAKVTMPRLPPR